MRLLLRSEPELEDLGRRLARVLRRGDCLLLSGSLGAGKTTLARALIRERAGAPIDVPSPTYALVEVYDFDTPVHHIDLYRLGGADQAVELGLEDLFEAGITLIEWPDRAEGLYPGSRLDVAITEPRKGERMVELLPRGEDWSRRLEALALPGQAL